MVDAAGQRMLRPEECDDTELVTASRAGNQAAFAELWRRHHKIAISITRPLAPGDADDIVAETFTSIWGKLQAGSGPREHFRAYVISTCRNMAARSYRDRQRTVTVPEVEDEPVAGCAEVVTLRESRQSITHAFSLLPERWQKILWWQEVEDIPRTEIAQRMNLSPNSVSALTRRAKEGLRIEWLRLQLPRRDAGEHDDVVEDLPKYLRGSLQRKRHLEVRGHLEQCSRCYGLEKELRNQNRALGLKLATTGAFATLVFAGVTGAPAGVPVVAGQAALLGAGQQGLHFAVARSQEALIAAKMVSVPVAVITAVGSAAIAASLFGASLAAPEVERFEPNAAADARPAKSEADSSMDSSTRDSSQTTTAAPAPPSSEVDEADTASDSTSGIPATDPPVFTAPAPAPAPPQPTNPPTPTDPVEPTTPTNPATQETALTVRLVSEHPPQLAGTATTGSFVRIAVSGQSLLIWVDPQHNWFADMTSLALAPGTYPVTVSQHIGDQRIDSIELVITIIH